MAIEYPGAEGALLTRRDVDQPDDAVMANAANDRQLGEVLVEGHQDSLLPLGKRQDLAIPRVLGPLSRPEHIVAGAGKRTARSAPDASVQEDPHRELS